jgi:DNA polymerase-3 subunit epsilon
MREIVFDTETTGRDPDLGDRIVEIGCVEIENLIPTGVTKHFYLDPGREVPDEVVRVHGLTTSFLKGKPKFEAIVDELLEFFADAPLIAHNAEFDRKFLNAELGWIGRRQMPSSRFIDSLPIARAMFPGAANSLDALSRRFQLDRMGFDLAKRKGAGGHGALIDARMLAEVYLQLKGGRERSLAFIDNIREAAASGEAAPLTFERRDQRPVPLPSRLTPEEAAAHAAFIDDLGAPALWRALEAPLESAA